MKANLQTSIDTFVDEIKKRGKISFSEAQKIFGISEDQVEEWAKLLSEHKDEVGIEVLYPTFGEPVIVATAIKKSAEIQQKVARLEKNTGQLENILEKYSETGAKQIPKKMEKPAERLKEAAPVQKKEKGSFFHIFGKQQKPPAAEKISAIKEDLHLLEKELEEAKKVEHTIDELTAEAKKIEEGARGVQTQETKIILKSQSVQKTLGQIKNSIDSAVPQLQKRIHAIEASALSPELVSEIKNSIRRINADVKEIEAYAQKFEGKKAKSRLASLLKKAATPRKLRKKIKKHEQKRRKIKAKRR